ncbi:MAG: DUF2577 family protein [Eubacterium sp.]|nr:DUF2577 family protein [Eubacterium sp.]MBR1761905.1 DUF2577 family protein [Eubacterium sp.]
MATSIKGTLQSICGGEVGIYTGKVSATNPLSVTLQGDSNMRIGEALILLPEHLQKRTVKMTIDGETKNITVDESLKNGDTVYVVSLGRGSRYLIVGRC